jgi:hypothetical protein
MHIIITIFDPSRYEFLQYPQVSEENADKAYDLSILGNKFRSIRIIKNNEGETGVRIGVLMNPLTGDFEELPKPDSDEMKMVYRKFKENNQRVTKSKGVIKFDDDEMPF